MNVELSRSATPSCGTYDKRNLDYHDNFTVKKFFDFLISTDEPIIFDVGGHRGESIEFFKEIYPNARIYSFEPEPENYEILAEVSKKYNSISVNAALGDENESVIFYKQDLSHLGGLLPINSNSLDSLGYAKNAKNEMIEVKKITLDSFCKEHSIDKINVLKIDTQGYEAGVLKGAELILANTDCILVEISLYDFYQNPTSSLFEVEKIMSQAGFKIWDISKISKNPKNLRTDWIEVVYRADKNLSENFYQSDLTTD